MSATRTLVVMLSNIIDMRRYISPSIECYRAPAERGFAATGDGAYVDIGIGSWEEEYIFSDIE